MSGKIKFLEEQLKMLPEKNRIMIGDYMIIFNYESQLFEIMNDGYKDNDYELDTQFLSLNEALSWFQNK